MKKILLILLLLIPVSVNAVSLPEMYSKNVIVYDRTDNLVLHEVNSEKELAIASLTKIMTTITSLEEIENLDEKITVTKKMLSNIKWDASRAGLVEGDVVTYRDLLYASMLPSGADATQCLAYSLNGSIEAFVEQMNKNAKRLNMNNTNFVNVTGLDVENHYSTVSDVLKMLNYALENKIFREIYSTKEYTLTTGKTVKSTVSKYGTKLNLDVSRIIGSKTGFTDNAGFCISILFESNGHEFIFISTAAAYVTGDYYHVRDALKVIDFIDNNYNNQLIINKDVEVKNIPVNLSKQDNYIVKTNTDIYKYLANDYDKNLIRIDYEGLDSLDYNIKEQTKIGEIKYYYNNELVSKEDVILDKKIEMDLKKVIKAYQDYLICFGIFILIIINGIGLHFSIK